MNSKTAVIWGAVVLSLMGVIGLTVFLLQGQQDVRSRAQIPSETAQSCPTPAKVQNVLVEFPSCVGDVCNFTQASCSWNSVAGATKYQVKIFQVESTEVVKDEQVEAAVTRVQFSVVQNKTYKCEVAAINSCGAVGLSGSHSLLCEVDAALVTPTPIPPTPTIVTVGCGFPCASNNNCQAGLVCAIPSGGQGYCAIPSLENACKSSPSISSCCSTPTTPPTSTPIIAKPTIVPPGGVESIFALGVGATILLLLGFVLIAL